MDFFSKKRGLALPAVMAHVYSEFFGECTNGGGGERQGERERESRRAGGKAGGSEGVSGGGKKKSDREQWRAGF